MLAVVSGVEGLRVVGERHVGVKQDRTVDLSHYFPVLLENWVFLGFSLRLLSLLLHDF